jgi:hypothetical protein
MLSCVKLCPLLSCRTHPLPLQILQMTLFVIVFLGGVPLGVITYDDPEYWATDVDQWVHICFDI